MTRSPSPAGKRPPAKRRPAGTGSDPGPTSGTAAKQSDPRSAGGPAYRRSAGSARGEARRRDLLDRVADDLAANGLVDFSLRRAARAAGTTHKVLLYYFDGADDLLTQAILKLRDRRIDRGLAAAARDPDRPLSSRVRDLWPALVAEEGHVLDQAIGLSMYDPARYAALGHGASQQYLPALLSLLPETWPERRRLEIAELILGALRGFLIDRLTSGTTDGVDAGLDALARALDREEATLSRAVDKMRTAWFTSSMEIDLSAGTLDYLDTGGGGPTLVLLHGLLMDSSLWDGPIADLSTDHRCIAPTLPLGAHRHPVSGDLSLPAIARLVEEFLDRLDLHDVTLVGNDTGGALVQLVLAGKPERVVRAVLVSCEAFDNVPPGLTGKVLVLSGRLSPRLFGAFMQQLRLRAVRRLPIAFGWLTKRGDATTARWIRPVLTSQQIRRDTVRMLRAIDGGAVAEATAALPSFHRPALVVWAAEDRVMPPEHGRRLAELLPDARLVEVADSYTLVPLDQPAALAGAVRDFVMTAVI
jgi:pimeloyl-ACP methyl ester carboxylesterase/AcrR family transcriptional regulator